MTIETRKNTKEPNNCTDIKDTSDLMFFVMLIVLFGFVPMITILSIIIVYLNIIY